MADTTNTAARPVVQVLRDHGLNGEDGILIRMPGTEYVLSPSDAYNLTTALVRAMMERANER